MKLIKLFELRRGVGKDRKLVSDSMQERSSRSGSLLLSIDFEHIILVIKILKNVGLYDLRMRISDRIFKTFKLDIFLLLYVPTIALQSNTSLAESENKVKH